MHSISIRFQGNAEGRLAIKVLLAQTEKMVLLRIPPEHPQEAWEREPRICTISLQTHMLLSSLGHTFTHQTTPLCRDAKDRL
ncbi:hypothetical protein BFJ66_g16174 [Fusarium oxysporum f. sp. cepae]|uniref:Uncharacterized protein n=1 Tax=Fusarium oxysporum f. sp. cepae TaxID=396571 RepID=A0A3L6MT29_FUSOX|nr:hypothetical protein BFJ65_g18186 [Fusarium oxysporum f. sp. cepae]RKK30736.1 hypothetical protein BFJ66_g16174 [Fusarium oxysporum f. sp. cepae]RKK36113.1 hypothetical protein BFJ67_g12963 [Fusarium oxysporum f. sp. cepae]